MEVQPRYAAMRGGTWRRVTSACGSFGCVCGRIKTPLAVGFPRVSRSTLDDHSGTYKKFNRSQIHGDDEGSSVL